MKQVLISGDADMMREIVKKLDVRYFALYMGLGDIHTAILTEEWKTENPLTIVFPQDPPSSLLS